MGGSKDQQGRDESPDSNEETDAGLWRPSVDPQEKIKQLRRRLAEACKEREQKDDEIEDLKLEVLKIQKELQDHLEDHDEDMRDAAELNKKYQSDVMWEQYIYGEMEEDKNYYIDAQKEDIEKLKMKIEELEEMISGYQDQLKEHREEIGRLRGSPKSVGGK